MPLINIRIENFKSIKRCDISTDNINLLIGANGTGKSNVLDAIDYFYKNLTEQNLSEDIYDANNRFSNQVSITLTFDLSSFVMISRTHTTKSRPDFRDAVSGKIFLVMNIDNSDGSVGNSHPGGMTV